MDKEEIDNKIVQVSYNFGKTIFNNLNFDIFDKLIFTKDSIYSSSKIKGANRLINILLKVVGININELTITDGTANIGTDSLELSKFFKKINSVEYSEFNYNALVNNVNILNTNKNIKCYEGDINNVIKTIKQDIIYIDAPWGGINYKEYNKLKLYLDKVEILDFYLNNKDRAKFFIFKIPFNYDFDYLRKYIINKFIIYPHKKDNRIKYFLLVIDTCN